MDIPGLVTLHPDHIKKSDIHRKFAHDLGSDNIKNTNHFYDISSELETNMCGHQKVRDLFPYYFIAITLISIFNLLPHLNHVKSWEGSHSLPKIHTSDILKAYYTGMSH